MNKVQIAFLVAGLFACSAVAYPSLVGSVVGGVGSLLPQVPTTLEGALVAANQVYNNLSTTMQENYKRLTAVLCSALAGEASFDQIYAYLLTGVYIALSNNTNTTNSLGGLGLPTAFLCQLGLHYEYSSCYICNEDCYVAHNLWGGGCGPSPITGNQTCLCAESADEAKERNLTPNSTATCASYNPAAGEESLLIGLAFRARYIAVQCLVQADGSYDSTGCNVDCTQNHGFASGICQIQKPNVPMPTGTYLSGNDAPTAYCICSHNNQPNTTFALPPPSGAGNGNLLTGAGYYIG